jgi:hypothetical protein
MCDHLKDDVGGLDAPSYPFYKMVLRPAQGGRRRCLDGFSRDEFFHFFYATRFFRKEYL